MTDADATYRRRVDACEKQLRERLTRFEGQLGSVTVEQRLMALTRFTLRALAEVAAHHGPACTVCGCVTAAPGMCGACAANGGVAPPPIGRVVT
jgi:hypothetical protein